ncbi:MAG: hypothetical protein CSA64_05400 [Arachnia propionica]|nr:MAG: hypothetical protein CSA64_05400 [Arachnia propionica]
MPVAKLTGLMIPTRERASVDAVTFRQRGGYAVVRAYFGRNEPELTLAPKPQVLSTILGELERLFGLSASPVASELFQWSSGYPQTQVGHLQRIAAIERELPPGFKLAGSPYRGISVADCIKQGRDAVADLAR